MKPMKLTDVPLAVVEKYLTDDQWVMQQKHDGARMVVSYDTDTGITFWNGSGEPMSFSAAKLKLGELQRSLEKDFDALGIDTLILDGELIIETGVYHVFDLISLWARGGPLLNDSAAAWWMRDEVLREELAGIVSPVVQFAVTARTELEKRELWSRVNESAVEGAVSKWLGSLYTPDSRTKMWVKHKLVKAADVVVTAVDRTFKADGKTLSHGKAELAVPIDPWNDPLPWENAKGKRLSHAALNDLQDAKQKPAEDLGWNYTPRVLLPVGNASLIGKELTIDVGSVVECNYLYWTGDAMVQPRIVRQRFDKTAAECSLDQFPAYTREVVQL